MSSFSKVMSIVGAVVLVFSAGLVVGLTVREPDYSIDDATGGYINALKSDIDEREYIIKKIILENDLAFLDCSDKLFVEYMKRFEEQKEDAIKLCEFPNFNNRVLYYCD